MKRPGFTCWISFATVFSFMYFAWFVFLVFRDYCVALPRGAMGLSAICDCGIS